MIRAVIFDLDGTLYDYESCNLYAENILKERVKQLSDISDNKFTSIFCDAKKQVKKRTGNTAASHNRFLYMQEICERLNLNVFEYVPELYSVYWGAVLSIMKPYSYVKKTFDYLKNREIKIAILTDLTAQIQYKKIEQLDITSYVDFITTSEEVGEEKPSPRMFKGAMEKMGLYGKEILMVGDDYEKDILGAKSFNMKTLLFRDEINTYEKICSICRK